MGVKKKLSAKGDFQVSAKDLAGIADSAEVICKRFNAYGEQVPWSVRQELFRHFLGRIGKQYYFAQPIQFNYGKNTFIGENFLADSNLCVMDEKCIVIGDNVFCGPNVSLLATENPALQREIYRTMENPPALRDRVYTEGIHIGSNVCLGANVRVMDGVRIGAGSIVEAGSVVLQDIPAKSLAAGAPCKLLRPVVEKDRQQYISEFYKLWNSMAVRSGA